MVEGLTCFRVDIRMTIDSPAVPGVPGAMSPLRAKTLLTINNRLQIGYPVSKAVRASWW